MWNRQKMLRRLKAGYSPIRVSLEKWYELKKKWDRKIANKAGNCALCETYGCCEDTCPLRQIGKGCVEDDYSPYDKALESENAQPMIDALLEAEKWQEEQKCRDKPKPGPSFQARLRRDDVGSFKMLNNNYPGFRLAFTSPNSDAKKLNRFLVDLEKNDDIYIVTKDKLKKEEK